MRASVIAAAFAGLVGVVVGALGLGLVSASHDANVIHGCVGPNGLLSIATDSADCKSNEVPIEWGIEGPQGNNASTSVYQGSNALALPPGAWDRSHAVCLIGDTVIGGGFKTTISGDIQVMTSKPSTLTIADGRTFPSWEVEVRNHSSVTTHPVFISVICLAATP